MRKFALYFVLFSLVLFAVPLGIGIKIDFVVGLLCGFVGSVLWMIALDIGVQRYGVRGWWLLTTAPLGLFYPILFAYWLFRAGQGDPKWMMP